MKFLISILSLLSVALVGRAAPASLDGIQYKTTPFRLYIENGREREYIKAVNNSLVISSESQNLACARTPYPNEATFYLQSRLLFLYSNQEPRQRVYVKGASRVPPSPKKAIPQGPLRRASIVVRPAPPSLHVAQ